MVRGLCADEVRSKGGVTMNCRHCKRPYKWRIRGLCKKCYRSHDIRPLYSRMPNNKSGYGASNDDQTEAELNELVESRRATMPPMDHEPDDSVGVYIPQVVLAGRGVRSRSFDY